MRHIIPISGKDSCATALVQMAREPEIPYEFHFTDVGAELPETYEWLNKVEKTLEKPIVRVGKSLEGVIAENNMLPSRQRRFCTREAKIHPMEKWIGKDEATVYLGIRADEDRVNQFTTKKNITHRYPLRELGIGLPAVYLILEKKDLLPPAFFWQRMYDSVCRIYNNQPEGFGWRKKASELFATYPRHIFTNLFAWRTRSNCFFCFFQRKYEWVGLLEHHPDLFTKAEKIEHDFGTIEVRGPLLQKDFYWRSDGPLAEIRKNADKIFQNRVDDILSTIRTKRISLEDDMSVVSCGLFCGK
jgi:Phosphoadenosine phosphosulfate reductase family